MNLRRLSFVLGDYSENEVDESFKSLYPSSEIIEKRCAESVRDKNSLSVSSDLASRLRPAFPSKISYDKTFQQVIDALPGSYYQLNFDPVVSHLEEISSWIDDETIEKFMAKIEATDTDKDIIIGEITSMIDANYDDLMSCMRKIQEVSYELKSAGGSISSSRENIKSCNAFIVNGALKVKNLSSKKKKLISILDTTEKLKLIQHVNSLLLSKINAGEVGDAAEQALNLAALLHNEGLLKFAALRTIREGFVRSLVRIKGKSDKALNRIACRRFSPVEYENILKSYIILDFLSIQMDISDDPENLCLDNVLDNIPKLLNHYFFLDIESCLISAAVETICQAHQKKQRRASEVNSISMRPDMMELAEVPINVVYKKVTPELFPQCVVRSCEMLADVIHTHFLITRWHLAPFSEKNFNWDYLNSVSTDSNEAEEVQVAFSEEPEILKGIQEYLSKQTFSLNPNYQNLLTRKFSALTHGLEQSKSIIWDEMTRGLISVLRSTNFSGEMKQDDFVRMMSTLRSFVEVGKQFNGSNSTHLCDFLQEKSTKYFMNYHVEALQMLKVMLEAELWQAISVGENDEVNTTAVILKTIYKDTNKQLDESEEQLTAASSDELQLNTDEFNPFQSPLKMARSPLNRRNSRQSLDFMEDKGSTPQRKANKTALIVTQSALNGVVKSTVKYMDILSSTPTNSSDVVDCMAQLFDLYLCAIFYGFVPSDERSRLLSPPAKMTSPPPDLNREYQVMRIFVEKASNEQILIRTHEEFEADVDPSNPDFTNFETTKLESLLSVPFCVANGSAGNFFGLKERIVAAESCEFVAQILREIKMPLTSSFDKELTSKFSDYVENFSRAADQLRSFVYKSLCPILLNQNNSILNSFLECQWDTRKPPEIHHEWVEKLINSCRKVWDFVSSSNDFLDVIQEQIWLELCQAAFDLAIEGFSRIRKCSAEGRAAMTMDLFALHEGLNKIHLCRPPRGKHYIENYLRTFYLTEDEIMRWIHENWQSYAYRHLYGLLQQTMTSILNSKKLRDAVSTLDSLYEIEEGETNKLTSLLSSRFKEESRFANLIAGKFRR